MITLTNRIFRGLAIVALSGALTSCDTLLSTFHITHHARTSSIKPSKTHYLAEAYVKHLTLARLTLATTTDDTAADHDLDVINAYAAQKPTRTEQQMLVVFEYKNVGTKTMQPVIAPIELSGKNQFSALLDIINQLSDGYRLHNVHLAIATIAPSDELTLPEDIGDIKQALDQQQRHLLDSAEKLLTLDDARVQLQLTRFFMDHHFRDAAYICVDNVKWELATASQDKSIDTDAVKQLSQELETVERKLHKTLPFTFSTQ